MTEEEFRGRIANLDNYLQIAQKKDTNPKDAVGIAKVPMSTVPSQVLMEVGLAMMEGARKYGRHNYRTAGVRTSVYYDAFMRHTMAFWEGEDNDPDSGLSHLVKAIATLVVLRDAYITGNVVDDRPPMTQPKGWMQALNAKAAALIAKYPLEKAAHTERNKVERNGQVQMETARPNDKSPDYGRGNGGLNCIGSQSQSL